MIEDWYEAIRLPISIEEFRALPPNPAYKYEYFDGCAYLSPRPKYYRAALELGADVIAVGGLIPRPSIVVRPLRDDDWDHLPPIFAAAFRRIAPFASLDDDRRLEAARGCLAKTRGGGDGPMVPDACFVAARAEDDQVVAAALATFQPSDEDGLPGPHLTWIFVSPLMARFGIGSALLATLVRRLHTLGYESLASTFSLGNESSTLWHWRNGFRLLGFESAPRQLRRLGEEEAKARARTRRS